MPQLDEEISGLIGVIESDQAAHEPVEEPVDTTPKGEGSESTTETETKEEVKTDSQESETPTEETGTPAEGQTENTEAKVDEEPSKTETTEQEDFSKWKDQLPPAPTDYAGKQPEYDADGNITNMGPQEYQEFLIGKAMEGADQRNYQHTVENRALDIAEKILPDIKTNPAVRNLVESLRVASIVRGNEIDTVQAALQARDALGISPEKLQAAKTEGANSAKASVTIQKAAALETGSSEKKTSDKSEKITHLQKRIARGDDEAFAELLGIMDRR